MPGDSDYALRQPLPDDVLVGGNTVWSRYRQYPVFSAPWLRGRTLLFASAIGSLALVVWLGVGATLRDYAAGFLAGAHLFAAFMLMATLGPGLATLVRHRRWPRPRERALVVAAVAIGVGLGFPADRWASAHVERKVLAAAGDRAPPAPELQGGERILAYAVNGIALAAVYGLFGGGLALRAYFSEQRRWRDSVQRRELQSLRRQKQDADLRLGMLQAQVEPHFLFNTLASVRALVRQDPARAEATLDALVEHLRATIPRLRDDARLLHSTLGQQLDICRSYLDVVRLRTDARLDYAIEAAPGLRAQPYPPLLLITLVENAVKHGIEPKRGPGRILVRAAVEGDALAVAVIDDGVGLAPGAGGGVGLANVREQLSMRYGDRASVRLQGREGEGAHAEIRVPLERST